MRTTGSRGVGTAVARILLFLTTLIVLTKLAGSASAQTWTGAVNGNGGSLTYNGAGTLTLGSGSNTYGGGTIVNGGTLALGVGTAIPTGGNVTVNAGGTFSTAGLSNSATTAIGTLAVNGTGVFRVSSGSGNYYLNQLQMTDGTVDFSGSANFWLHFTGSGAGITINSGTSTWPGMANSRIQN